MASIPAGMLAKRLFPCFPAGTPILTATGWKPIEEIEAGDVVLSRDETDVNAPVGPQEVQEAHQREGEILTLTVGGKEINTTTEHPFWVKDRGWVEACDLHVGDELSTSGGKWVSIESIHKDGSVATVYNMTVKNWHTYFVGADDWGFDVWVHNNHNLGNIVGRGSDAIEEFVDPLFQRAVERSFRGDPLAIELTEDLVVVRHWGDEAGEIGSPWFTPKEYARPGNAKRYLALPGTNSADEVTEFVIPAGNTILKGKVAEQLKVYGPDAVGGGVQIYLPDPSVAIPVR